MVPSAQQFRRLLTAILKQYPTEAHTITLRDGSTVGERQLLISCVLQCADVVERLEKLATDVFAPALDALMKGSKPQAEAAPAATEEEEENMPPIAQATSTVTGPASAPNAPVAAVKATTPVNNGAAPTVTISAPTPIPPRG